MAARARFSENSYNSTTMQDIAGDADVAVGTLYSYFKDKVAIAEAISAQDLERVAGEALASLPSLPTTGVRAQLQHIFDAFYAHHRENLSLARVVVKELSLADDTDSPQREKRFMELFEGLGMLIASAQAAGEIAADVDPFDLGVNAFGLHYFYLIGWLSGQSGFSEPEQHLARALALLFRGLETTPSS